METEVYISDELLSIIKEPCQQEQIIPAGHGQCQITGIIVEVLDHLSSLLKYIYR